MTDTTNPISGILAGIEAGLANLALTPLTNIQTALNTIAANPGNQTVLLQEEAVIIASVNTLIAEAPAALPLLQSAAIAAGATEGATLVGKLISTLQGLTTPVTA